MISAAFYSTKRIRELDFGLIQMQNIKNNIGFYRIRKQNAKAITSDSEEFGSF